MKNINMKKCEYSNSESHSNIRISNEYSNVRIDSFKVIVLENITTVLESNVRIFVPALNHNNSMTDNAEMPLWELHAWPI